MTPNGSPSWKMIALALVSLATLLGTALVAKAADDINATKAGLGLEQNINSRQDREIVLNGVRIDNVETMNRERYEYVIKELAEIKRLLVRAR